MELPRTDLQEDFAPADPVAPAYPVSEKAARWAAHRPAHRPTLSTLLFLAFAILLVHGLAYIADTLAPDGNTRFLLVDRQHTRQILRSANSINALAMGNSHTGSIQMPALGYKQGYRFARADGDLFEGQYFLERLIPRLPQVEVVFIPVSYFAFLSDNAASKEVEIRRAHMYASLSSWQFIPGDLESFVIGKSHTYLPVTRLLREDNWETILYAVMGRPVEQKGFVEVEPGDCASLTEDELAGSVENRVDKYMRLTQEMKARHPGLAQDTDQALRSTIRFLQARGIRVVLFTPPYWKEYSAVYQSRDPDTLALMRSTMPRIMEELSVEYYDFSLEGRFISNPALFKDSDHLNSCGSELFSAGLRQAMEGGR